MVTELEYLGAFVIGCVASGAILFGSYVGLKDYQKLPKRIYTRRMAFIYLLFGGLFSVILQLVQDAFVPLQALAIGAGWPAVLLGYATSQSAKQIADDQFKELKEYIEKIQGGG